MVRLPKKLLTSGLALALLATACGSDLPTNENDNASNSGGSSSNNGTETITVNGQDLVLTSGLAQFDSCDALLTHLRTEGAERVGAFGFNHGNYWGGEDFFVDEEAMEDEEEAMEDDSSFDTDAGASRDAVAQPESAPSTTTQASGADGELVEGEDFSGTNNQESGVDEPDYVKTNGTRILTMTNGRFHYIDVDGDTPVKRGSINLNHSTQEMLIVGDTAYLFGNNYGEEIYYEEDAIDVDDAEASFADDVSTSEPVNFQGPSVEIIELDISNADSPTVVSRLNVDGHYLSARRIGDNISVALQSDQHDLGFVFPQGERGEETAERFNKEIVMETELSDWLPAYRLDQNGTTSSGQLADCADVHAPAEFAGFGSLSVLTFDGGDGLTEPGAASVLASGQNVYASTNSMWISTNQWYDWASFDEEQRREAEDSFTSQIHGFALGNDAPEYLASGSVRGTLLNQFAMSEYDGVLRVATTDGSAWGRQQNSESFVTTFAIETDGLRQLGQVGDMGRGEQIFAVRFVGDVGYVVTFRQTDPFYTVDLSDPANPTVLGELKITGFSGQLHPLGPDHVLGIGQEATEEGFQTGAKVTLFDVSDLSNPIDVANWTVDNSWSDAQWDHKAFLWWPQENLAVLPVQNYSEQFWGAIAFRIDLDEGTITEAGRLTHEPDAADAVGTTDCRVLDSEVFGAFSGDRSELGEIAQEITFMTAEGGQMQDCGPGQTGATGLYCENWDWLELNDEQRDAIGLEGTLEFCWPEGPGQDPIIRTLITGDTLWSLSWSRLQANDLATFEPGEFVTVG